MHCFGLAYTSKPAHCHLQHDPVQAGASLPACTACVTAQRHLHVNLYK
jgi:hypothetical protein